MVLEALKTFLQSSTIHGLYHIASTKHIVRLFWIFVVFTCFSFAGILIYQAFQTWSDSPVSTTIETLPITEVQFPMVTICPPKGSTTNLNYDLMMVENKTLDEEFKMEITNYAYELLNDFEFEEVIANLSVFHEDNRFTNWYKGYTNFYLPNSLYMGDYMEFNLKTYSPSGSIYTKYFQDSYDSSKVNGRLWFSINLYHPFSMKDSVNKSMFLHFEKTPVELPGKERWGSNYFEMSSENNFNMTISPVYVDGEDDYKSFLLERTVSDTEIEDLEQQRMPGFKVDWSYSQEYVPDTDHAEKKESRNYYLRWFINSILESNATLDSIWQIIKRMRVMHEDDAKVHCYNTESTGSIFSVKKVPDFILNKVFC